MKKTVSTMDSLFDQIKGFLNNADVAVRHQACEKLHELAMSIATPRQTMIYYGYMYTEHAMAQTAVDLGLFEILDESKAPLKTEEIASKTGGSPALIGTERASPNMSNARANPL